jgi:hypothetical protein
VIDWLKPHWRTALGAAIGATGGGLYAHFVGCHTGTCLITSTVWNAAIFFGATGAIVGLPGPRREAPEPRRALAERSRRSP